jgi:hypothetical protein
VSEKEYDPEYANRVRLQGLAWVAGMPFHNRIDDECCPDFSCCHPELFEEDQEKRAASLLKMIGEKIG